MGYVLVVVVGIVLVPILFISIVGGSKKPAIKKLGDREHITLSKPAADAPAPGDSMATPKQPEEARRHTPLVDESAVYGVECLIASGSLTVLHEIFLPIAGHRLLECDFTPAVRVGLSPIDDSPARDFRRRSHP